MANPEQVFFELYQTYHERIYFFALKRIRDEQFAEDLVQSVFLKIWERQSILITGNITEAFVFTIARNLLIDHYHKRLLQGEQTLPEHVLDESEPAAAVYERDNENMDALTQAIAALPEGRRRVFLLNRQHGLTYKEIAEELSISPKTVENQISAALKTLRRRLAHLFYSFLA